MPIKLSATFSLSSIVVTKAAKRIYHQYNPSVNSINPAIKKRNKTRNGYRTSKNEVALLPPGRRPDGPEAVNFSGSSPN